MNKVFVTLSLAVSAALNTGAFAASPAVAEAYVYRVTNGYSREVAGEVTYRVEKLEGDRVSVAVTPSAISMGMERTEIYTRDGNGLRHVLFSHDQLVEYDFASAYPAYQFPLETGKSWSVRVMATVPSKSKTRSVRVDAEVLGPERVTVGAGTFETIKIRRQVYAGDTEMPYSETEILEFDWYAPALGRTVRSETKSRFLNLGMGGDDGGVVVVNSDWNVLELIRHGAN